MDFELNEEQRAFQDAAQSFADTRRTLYRGVSTVLVEKLHHIVFHSREVFRSAVQA